MIGGVGWCKFQWRIYTRPCIGVAFDGSVALVNGQPIIATPEGSSIVIDQEKASLTFEGYEVRMETVWEWVRLWMDLLHHQLLRHLQLIWMDKQCLWTFMEVNTVIVWTEKKLQRLKKDQLCCWRIGSFCDIWWNWCNCWRRGSKQSSINNNSRRKLRSFRSCRS